jgi:hypothetical protein
MEAMSFGPSPQVTPRPTSATQEQFVFPPVQPTLSGPSSGPPSTPGGPRTAGPSGPPSITTGGQRTPVPPSTPGGSRTPGPSGPPSTTGGPRTPATTGPQQAPTALALVPCSRKE